MGSMISFRSLVEWLRSLRTSIKSGRREEDKWIITRTRLAALFILFLSFLLLSMSVYASEGKVTHSLFASLSAFAAAALWFVSDERCRPKLRRLNTILMRALAKRLKVDDPGEIKS